MIENQVIRDLNRAKDIGSELALIAVNTHLKFNPSSEEQKTALLDEFQEIVARYDVQLAA